MITYGQSSCLVPCVFDDRVLPACRNSPPSCGRRFQPDSSKIQNQRLKWGNEQEAKYIANIMRKVPKGGVDILEVGSSGCVVQNVKLPTTSPRNIVRILQASIDIIDFENHPVLEANIEVFQLPTHGRIGRWDGGKFLVSSRTTPSCHFVDP